MRKGIIKRAIGILTAAVLAASPAAPAALVTVFADSRRVVTIGADLTEAQRNSVVKYFGVDLNKVDVIYITNQDERDHLSSWVPLEQIGTRTISCAYVQPRSGGGIQVKTANFNWVTSNMIASALSTSGVKNCEVVAAAPFEVSGTGALTGAIMAYEAASGENLDSGKKDTAVQELVTTSQVAESVGQQQATQIVNEIKIDVISSGIPAGDADRMNEIVNNAVDNAVNNASLAGTDLTVSLSDEDREALIALAESIAGQNYNYEDVQETLERVEQNVTTGNQDVTVNVNVDNSGSGNNTNTNTSDNNNTASNDNTNTGENNNTSEQTQELPEDSILASTDDYALGDAVIVDATTEEALEDVPMTFEEAEQSEGAAGAAADAPFEITTVDEGGLSEDGTAITLPDADDAGTVPEDANTGNGGTDGFEITTEDETAVAPGAGENQDALTEEGAEIPDGDTYVLTDEGNDLPDGGADVVTDEGNDLPDGGTDVVTDEGNDLPDGGTDVVTDEGSDLPDGGTDVVTDEGSDLPDEDTGAPTEDGTGSEETDPGVLTDEGDAPEDGDASDGSAADLKIGGGEMGEPFDGFALRLYMTAGEQPSGGTVVIRNSAGEEVARADLADGSTWKAGPVEDGADACIYVFTGSGSLSGLGADVYHVEADVTDSSGASLNAEADVSFDDSLRVSSSSGFAAGGTATLYVEIPEGGSADISSSDSSVASPQAETVSAEAGAEGVPVGLSGAGETELAAQIYDADGEYVDEVSVKIRVF